MYKGIAVLCAWLVSRLIGSDLFLAVFFGTLGFFAARTVLRQAVKPAPYPLFVLILCFGLAAEILTALGSLWMNQDTFYAAWLFFVPTLFFLFFSRGIPGAGRRIWGIGYAVILMLLHLYAKTENGEAASLSFLPLQASLLYAAIYSVKQKNDAS